MKSLFLPFLFGLLVSAFFSISRSSNTEKNNPFRMGRVNIVWQKAKQLLLSQEKLDALYVELERQDSDEIKWKHQKQDGKDNLGEAEAIIRRNLMNIMERYGLLGAGEEGRDHIETNRAHDSSFKKDERLEKLWEHAKNEAQFSKEELEKLREELTHHHDKWKQYRDLVGIVSAHKDRQNNIVGKNIPHEEAFSKLQEEMNMKCREVDSSYCRLKKKVLSGAPNEEFQDHRVRDLWKRAQVQGYSEEELDIMKEELRHFDNRIAKHDDLQEQLDVAEDMLNNGQDHIKPKFEKLTEKVNEHREYIKKLHTTLEKRIGPRNEL
ncbi:alpha-2-macroglobulin receptor-associated protein-like isoform X2 [Dendronephthya gigantea]|uniref:alpha-2-macroglobulin receptor-associated protein-like isoform X2 n=1 Tax=Dendronephthya gigantea TaxID=151771 RepID=UPI00106B8C0C|nr:alpha-2-macroglobulin receptor-associated protein-like isoform X2 [Dendronephthya gigantea]